MISIHAICNVAQRGEPCTICHVLAGQPCAGHGTHLCRICLAAHDGLLTYRDAASVMHDMDVFTGAALIFDAEAVTA